MEAFIHRLIQVLAAGGLASLIIGLVLDISGIDYWRAYPSNWFGLATSCGMLAVAGKICWPSKPAAGAA